MVADNARERNVSYDNDWAIGYLANLVRITMHEDYREGASIFSPGLLEFFLIVHSSVVTMSNKPSLSKSPYLDP